MAQRMSRLKKIIVIAAVGALSLGGAGVAFAYWTSTGTGTGGASTAQAVQFTILAEDPVGTLAPGSAGQTVAFTVTNPGPGTLYFSFATVTIADADGVPWVPPTGCLLADYTATITTQPTTGQLAAAATASGGVVTVTLANTSVNQDACKGQDVPLYFTASSDLG